MSPVHLGQERTTLLHIHDRTSARLIPTLRLQKDSFTPSHHLSSISTFNLIVLLLSSSLLSTRLHSYTSPPTRTSSISHKEITFRPSLQHNPNFFQSNAKVCLSSHLSWAHQVNRHISFNFIMYQTNFTKALVSFGFFFLGLVTLSAASPINKLGSVSLPTGIPAEIFHKKRDQITKRGIIYENWFCAPPQDPFTCTTALPVCVTNPGDGTMCSLTYITSHDWNNGQSWGWVRLSLLSAFPPFTPLTFRSRLHSSSTTTTATRLAELASCPTPTFKPNPKASP